MKKTLSFILAVMMLLGCMSITAFAAASGTGTENDPYLLSTLEVNDIIIATDYVKNDTENTLNFELRFIDRETQETEHWAPQLDPGETIQFTFDEYSNDTQFIYKGFDETALWGGAYVFDVPPTQKIGGTAEITAEIKTAGFEYEMVIPTATTLTEANHENVLLGTDGKVSITNVKNPTDNVSVSYTVDLTDGDLTDGTTTINATYKYKQGDAEFAAIDGTTKVTVYENKTVNDSFVNVTADKDQWNAAPAGTYNATVVFNFSAEEKTAKVIIADILPDNFPTEALSSNWSNNMACNLWVANGNLYAKGGWETSVPVSTELTLVGDKYTCTTDTDVWTFTMDGESFCKATISDSTVDFELNGDYTQAK